MRIAFIFAGQATAMTGMPKAWSRRSEQTATLLDEAARRAGVPLARLLGPATLSRTALFQPAMTALTLGVARELMAAGLAPDMVAGHSLGELSAAAAAGCMDPEGAVAVAVTRGRLMEREARRRPGGMLAFAAPDRRCAQAVVESGRIHGVANLAGHNMGGQWVVSGERSALAAIAATTATTALAVEGPWHSSLMAAACDEYRAALREAVLHPLSVPLVSSGSGRVVRESGELVEILVGQLTLGVDWVSTMSTLAGSGMTEYVVCGPARLLTRFVTAGHPGCRVHGVEWPEDLERVCAAVAA
jgi:[acyl-carrier-protein] S-malonyltransferase